MGCVTCYETICKDCRSRSNIIKNEEKVHRRPPVVGRRSPGRGGPTAGWRCGGGGDTGEGEGGGKARRRQRRGGGGGRRARLLELLLLIPDCSHDAADADYLTALPNPYLIAELSAYGSVADAVRQGPQHNDQEMGGAPRHPHPGRRGGAGLRAESATTTHDQTLLVTTTPSPPASTVSMPPTSSVMVASAPANSTTGNSNARSPHPPVHVAVTVAATARTFVAVSFVGFALWELARHARARRRGTTAMAVADKRDSLASAAAFGAAVHPCRHLDGACDHDAENVVAEEKDAVVGGGVPPHLVGGLGGEAWRDEGGE
uniref:Uncharacterized protein n=4 Tax=Oryza TaxID=4527 RepID=Q10R29_ORYSJ|nr:hypothetical protein LOC_Os03g07730 [Oryza sativa Japonica Group]